MFYVLPSDKEKMSMGEHAKTDRPAVTLTGQPLRPGGPQRLGEVLRELDLHPVIVDGHEVDAETAHAIEVLQDAGLQPRIIHTGSFVCPSAPPVHMAILPVDEL